MKSWATFLFGIFLGATIVATAEQRQGSGEYDLRNQIITNTERLRDQDRQIQEIHDWILTHDRQAMVSIEASSAELREIKIKLETHDRIIYGLGSMLTLIIIKIVSEFIARKEWKPEAHRPEYRYNDDDGDNKSDAYSGNGDSSKGR
jgi:hypothetical protein